MEEIKKKKKLNKKPLLICFAIALVFAVIGFIDIKSNAAESNTIDFNFIVWIVNENGNMPEKSNINEQIIGSDDIEVFYHQSHYEPVNNSDTYYQAFCVSKYPITHIKGNGSTYSGKEYSFNEQTFYVRQVSYNYTNTNGTGITGFVQGSFSYDNSKELNSEWLDTDEFAQLYAENNLDVKVDYNSFETDDDMPIVQNVDFDRLETSEFTNGENTKKIIDYIRFQPNPNYKLMIMLCPTVYSTYGSKDYVADFKKYEYSSWIYMCVADENLKEISCDLGTFVLPTDDSSDIKASDYYSYYEEILNTLPQNPFKPTMAYRLAYVDIDNGLIGPSTYIKPLAYNNLLPDEETYSYFTLYSDGSRNTEKIMNMKTWTTEYDATTGETPKDLDEVIQDMKDTVVNVGDYLKDKVVVDSNVDVQEATNWLYSVVNFIKGTPQVVGSVLGFLPQPILYGMYVCIFLGIIASGLAIVKALL